MDEQGDDYGIIDCGQFTWDGRSILEAAAVLKGAIRTLLYLGVPIEIVKKLADRVNAEVEAEAE